MTEPGLRISYMDYIGTVRFIGPVEGTPGIWLGIEWDDPTRGKHDGSKAGKRYFTCLVPGTGSFLRPSANICHGKSFLEALKSKYIEAYHGSGSQELVVLGSSQGAIQVEAVNLDKVRAKLSKVSFLREVSLDGESVARSNPPGTIQDTCPNIRGLDLSRSLIHSWETIAAIARELPSLQRLYLNQNRFQRPVKNDHLNGCFDPLTELRLNNTLMTWQDITTIIATMPKLQHLEIGYNGLTDVSFDPNHQSRSTVPVRTVNLDSNRIYGWERVCSALLNFPFLERVVLANNQIENIPSPTSQQGLPQLKHLSLSFNRLRLWGDISALAAWAPSLGSLTLIGNPVIADHAQNARPLVIARLATLQTLDGALISAKERRDAELYYLSHVVNHGPVSDEERCQEHPRWQELCSKYGKPDEIVSKPAPDTLKSRLLELTLYRTSKPTNLDTLNNQLKEGKEIIIRVLPTMILKTLRSKVRKALGFDTKTGVVMLLVMNDCALVALEEDRDSHDLSWIGLETGSRLLCFAS
ncbi:RNI-like protein [Macrolepiota fuliginosa MF-IS2]|uniref:U2 small nuclear ribonucleoprotein A' n=1 Tax=Macrolepiota fuliginosa MF-IS2 TaxID=1400762 RepID=A0A9P5XPN1_9AGAR|nr:RNI-like protein [Macrolepiota fuliginosa MF-IS2]